MLNAGTASKDSIPILASLALQHVLLAFSPGREQRPFPSTLCFIPSFKDRTADDCGACLGHLTLQPLREEKAPHGINQQTQQLPDGCRANRLTLRSPSELTIASYHVSSAPLVIQHADCIG